MTEQPRPEPLGYLILAGVAADLIVTPGVVRALFIAPLAMLATSVRWWVVVLSDLGSLSLPVALGSALLVAYLVHRSRSEVRG